MRVTSEPVPAVVGMATKGAGGSVSVSAKPDRFQVFKHFATIGEHGRDGLARIQGPAAAETDDVIALFGLGQSRPGPDRLDLGFPGHGERNRVHPSLSKEAKQPIGPARGTARDHKGSSAKRLRDGSRFAKRPRPDDHPLGCGEFESHVRSAVHSAVSAVSQQRVRAE